MNSSNSFETAASHLVEIIYDSPMDKDEQDKAIGLIDDMRSSFSAAVDDKDNLIYSLQESVDGLEGTIEDDCIEIKIDTGIGAIGYKANNLQDKQLMELLSDLLKKNGTYKVLRALESLNI
ncbi:hypothetical protein [Chitinophaga sp. CF418]|uniref:hypothetical protein n=1 Tax=Chitinophaga sp. CF418 TaxID=1855287 RepID=UPI000921BB57|nr:hypothetical protein [Chitinophaga sp. CF418]SHN45875.1 hypothetical protein SAMN05216311_1229 [Chitinophaga sp. CF418]